jgi:hypothetical protein
MKQKIYCKQCKHLINETVRDLSETWETSFSCTHNLKKVEIKDTVIGTTFEKYTNFSFPHTLNKNNDCKYFKKKSFWNS